MSNYTTELRYLIQANFDIGLKDYPIFDENYREILNNKIINHYFFREIGFETAELFKFYLNRTMNEIMPYYNQLYVSEKIEFDPFNNTKLSKEYSKNVKQDNTDKNSGTIKDLLNYNKTENKNSTEITNDNLKNVFSDTPQGTLSFNDVVNNKYASTAEINDNKSQGNLESTDTIKSDETNNKTIDTTLTSNITTLDEYLETISGYSNVSASSDLLLKYRKTFLNIDMQIIEELNNLFMLLW